MKWSLKELQRYKNEPLHVKEQLDLNEMLTERFPDQVMAVEPVLVDGYVSFKDGDVMLTLKVNTTLTVPSSRSLKPVQLPTQFDITEFYLSDASHMDRYEVDEAALVLDEDQKIDLDEAVGENLLLAIPLRVLADDESEDGDDMPTGSGWEVVSEEDYIGNEPKPNTVDPRLAKLKALLPDQDNENN
ncbi:hypothetical protein FC70_GL000538 [Paucilactobacillus oligofermentans DSM 15707 = LMG 22743]|uniref:Nucleic acid-binding protein n=1 Tax=Paucilactobacillus oligofermentans DSM 15707 = LMG 22743 TaxID=1423778 RepID=A0A0R1RHG1_9LACO|nr:YceD family protein [Paucilactobacillus oligofermentans]KRL55953.1 hypothetical protein FC70_GL000538 [Paucilactobacillus oligofermentans DSM 15707 = LMG 22743]CUS26065.1 Probable nucleic acid-binding protein [Paucilactobacillus oligofermentans DSM 15707 = LMG 22743]